MSGKIRCKRNQPSPSPGLPLVRRLGLNSLFAVALVVNWRVNSGGAYLGAMKDWFRSGEASRFLKECFSARVLI